MGKDSNVAIVDGILDAIDQSDEWIAIQNTDPWIRAADAALHNAIGEIQGMTADEEDNLTACVFGLVNAYTCHAFLYGVRVIGAVLDVASRPGDLSRHILQRTGAEVKV